MKKEMFDRWTINYDFKNIGNRLVLKIDPQKSDFVYNVSFWKYSQAFEQKSFEMPKILWI